jgi:FkbM family methyltransferase
MIVPIKVCDEEFSIEIFDEKETVSDIIREKTIYSINDLKLFNKFLNKGDYFIDAGANIGWHTLFGSKVVGNDGKVFAFEPNDKNFNLLESNVKLNKLTNVSVVKSAVTDYVGTGELSCSKVNFGDHVANTEFLNEVEKESIDCTTIDEYIKNNDIDASKIKLIKMDIQGSEPKALEGMKDLIKEHGPTLIIEYSPHHIKLCGSSPFDILAFIDKNDYVPYHIQEDRSLSDDKILQHVTVIDLVNATQKIFADKVSNGFDLLLIKGKR